MAAMTDWGWHLELTLDPAERGRRTVRFVLCGPDDDVLSG
jgi:hypothetical protein